MSSKIIIGIIIAAFFLIILPEASAQNVGCCCDPVVKNGSYTTKTACDAMNFLFVGPPPNITVTCSQHCNATLVLPPAAACGDTICQPTENETTCPADCKVVIGCGSPGFKPAPTNPTIKPVKAKKALKLSYTLPCPPDYINISRCEGKECTNFRAVTTIPPATTFTDEGQELKFNTDYTYSITAHYSLAGDSEPITITGNPGDLECWQQQGQFCLNYYSYDQYYEYLIKFGYGQNSASTFETIFAKTVNLTFGTRFNQAWQCNEFNRLIETSPKTSCTKEQYCMADEKGPRCATKEACNTGFDPFGLLATQKDCETGLLPRYCFYDRSTTTINRCYNCDPRMTCSDYKTQSACERDNCGTGECAWRPVIGDLGIGVCIDKRYNNCKLCNTNGTKGMESTKATSIIWDMCTEEKSNALSTEAYPCFYDADRKTSKSCDEATCADYTNMQCGSPEGGIKLNPDNSLAKRSTDPCDIGVCQYHLTTGCVKNADGNTGVGFQDCAYGDKTCEQDYYPPITTLIPTGKAGRIDNIHIRIFDKQNYISPPTDQAGKKGYKTYLCVINETNECLDARTFDITTSSNKLTLKNTVLKDGQKTLAKLIPGENTLAYYSRDAANNLETINEISFYACDNCSAPQIINITVTGGRVIGNKIYTAAVKPTFTFNFDEPLQVTYTEIMRPGESIQLTQLTTGMLETHEFRPVSALKGNYNLTLNGHNEKSIYFDSTVQYELIVDPDLAGLSITPEDGSILNKTTIDITLNFTKPATLSKVTLVAENYEPYIITETTKEITDAFKTTNNKTFTAKTVNATGGKNTIIIDAQGFNTLNIYKQSSFFIATQKPGIRLAEPTFGVTPYSIFGIKIETPIPSECKYIFDTPTAPSTTDFEFLNNLTGLGTIHNTTGLTIPYGSTESHPLHVYCKFEDFGIIQKTFNITLDPDPPTIISAYAEPEVIAERYFPDQELYVTTLHVQIDKPGFCKYSAVTSNFESMEGTFPGYDKIPKTSMSIDVNVTQPKTYQYWITCKAKNQLKTPPEQISFTIDLTLPLSVKSSTPRGYGTLNFTIGAVANKRVYCYWGEQPDDTTRCMGACISSYTQRQPITVPNSGEYTYYIKCAHVSGEQSELLEVPVLIDTTPPTKPEVDDTGLETDPDYTWSKSKIKVAFRSEDPESGISHYLITLREFTGNKIIFKDKISNVTTGQPIWISSAQDGTPFLLTNNKKYKFVVKAINKVGTASEPGESDGVTLDVTKTPPACQNGELDENEVDVDCGGECGPCAEGKKCTTNTDCTTNYCDNTCKTASCEDGKLNGLESDVDCGGQPCNKCENGQICTSEENCASEYCDLITNTCADAPPCADKQLTEGETDVDCGGACQPCEEGKNCQENTDCKEGLICGAEKACITEAVEEEAPIEIPEEIIPPTPERPTILPILYIVFIIFAIAGIGLGVFLYLKTQRERKKPEIPPRVEAKLAEAKKDELQKLKTFAKEEELPEKDWISLEKEIKKKPLPRREFEKVLERLKKIARKEKIMPGEPLMKLRAMLEEIGEEGRKEILRKYKLFKAGLLTKEEIEELFRKLKITAEYYRLHKEEFEKELETYGRKHK